MRRHNLEIGKQGERIAEEYLENKGYQILEHNFKTKYSEIDLICKKNSELIFVEVRTKTNEKFGLPEETINKDKIQRLVRAANAYVARKHWPGSYRIEAVCIVLNPNNTARRVEQHNVIS